MITAERLAEVVSYDPETGIFVWRRRSPRVGEDPAKIASWNSRYAGRAAGVLSHGYIRLSVDDEKIYAHRAAWVIVYGEVPPLIDHINQDKTDNRIVNLRIATKRVNAINSARRDNSSGFRGVIPSANGKRFVAQHQRPGKKNKYIGTFDSAEEAYAAYLAAVG